MEINNKKIPQLLEKYEDMGMNNNFGFYVAKTQQIPFIDKKGLIDKKEIRLYNFLTFDNKLVFDDWKNSINYYGNSNEILIFSISDKRGHEQYGAFNKNGELVIYPIFDSVRFLYENTDYLVCEFNKKYGLFKKDGKQIIPVKYNNITNSNEDLLGVYYKEKWGVIDINTGIDNPKDFNQYVIPPTYDYITPFIDGIATASYNNQTFRINKSNEKIDVKIKVKQNKTI